MSHVDSTSDDRTVNNAMRHNYRILSEDEKQKIVKVKDLGAEFVALLHEIGDSNPQGAYFGSRNLSLANTHIEDAVMRVVRHITE